jgi:2,3-bisphosphoglycerate-independent phosphoglycerate mutase
MPANHKPVVLIVRDGWGNNPNPQHDAFNAIKLADTPCNDALVARYPVTQIHTCGRDVGLPDDTMGNSEVGHQNIGAGRIVHQESVRISLAIEDGSFFDNDALNAAIDRAKANQGTVHLMGIASDAGVHGLMDHLYACLQACKRRGQNHVALHLFTDGRDTGPFTGINFVKQIEDKCNQIGVGWVASICGRYYAMDRDNRWERVRQAYDLITGRSPSAPEFDTAEEAIQDYYDLPTNDSQRGDEFITPRLIGDPDPVTDGDSVIFYNYRGDRPREITRAFVMDEFYGQAAPSPDSGEKGFDRGPKLDLAFVTMTAYQEELNALVNVAFPKPPKMDNIAGDYLAQLGKTQFRCAETEKFPHVTFFFNDYREEPFPGEAREMAQSPKVATYDLQPQMSAHEICDLVLARINADDGEDIIIVNFANGDMVGHTGKLDAAITAVQTVDACVQRIVDATLAKGGKLIVTADHGNAEQMFDPTTNAPHTAHTLYDVDCIIVDPDLTADTPLRPGGRLADVFPTALVLMGLDKPAEMTGVSLLEPATSTTT